MDTRDHCSFSFSSILTAVSWVSIISRARFCMQTAALYIRSLLIQTRPPFGTWEVGCYIEVAWLYTVLQKNNPLWDQTSWLRGGRSTAIGRVHQWIYKSFHHPAAQSEDIVNIDGLYFHFQCFAEGETAIITSITANNDGSLEGPEVIGFTLGEASNVPGATAFGNVEEIVINDQGLLIL